MSEYNDNLSRNTRIRTLESVTKSGYTDGVCDGQAAQFQESFNIGYKQGFDFGFELGFQEAIPCNQQMKPDLHDQRRINCQICINTVKDQENIVNLYNIQQEKNNEYLGIKGTTDT
uniref:Essential protein Yae1 N-terminal domain-containing protein n=1 Tax=Heliothis virescens TaxID=7102 RepID=A0A2A4JMI9_HELVI